MFIASLRLLVLFVDYILLTYFSFLFWMLRSNRSALPEDAGLFRRLEIERGLFFLHAQCHRATKTDPKCHANQQFLVVHGATVAVALMVSFPAAS